MRTNTSETALLQYRIRRYRAMCNGAMCQALLGRLQKLRASTATTE